MKLAIFTPYVGFQHIQYIDYIHYNPIYLILFVGYHPLLLGFTPPASATASTAPGALGMRPPGFMGGRYQFNFPTTWLNIMFGCAKFLTSIIGAIEIDGSYQPFSQ